jgi:hypothetical protein
MGIEIGCGGRGIRVIGAALIICAAGPASATGVAQIIHAAPETFSSACESRPLDQGSDRPIRAELSRNQGRSE